MTHDELREQLSAIEYNDGMYDRLEPSDVPTLVELLQDDEPWMASRAVFALSQISDVDAGSVLEGCVTDSRTEVRVALAVSVKGQKIYRAVIVHM